MNDKRIIQLQLSNPGQALRRHCTDFWQTPCTRNGEVWLLLRSSSGPMAERESLCAGTALEDALLPPWTDTAQMEMSLGWQEL